MTIADAARLVSGMAGQFRVPDALKLADRLARGLEPPGASGNLPLSGSFTLAGFERAVGADRVLDTPVAIREVPG